MKMLPLLILSAACLLAEDNKPVPTTDPVTTSNAPAVTRTTESGDPSTVSSIPLGEAAPVGLWSAVEINIPPDYVANITWGVSSSNSFHLLLSTNLSTNWVSIRQVPAKNTNYVTHRQVGTIQTNRTLTITQAHRTNTLILDILGEQEWSTQKRAVTVPISKR